MVSATAGVVNEQHGDEWAECTILGTISHFEPPNALYYVWIIYVKIAFWIANPNREDFACCAV